MWQKHTWGACGKPNPKPKAGFFKYWRRASCWICSWENPAKGLKFGSEGVAVLACGWPPRRLAKGFKEAAWLNWPRLDCSWGCCGLFWGSNLEPWGSNLEPKRPKSSLKPGGGLTRISWGPSRLLKLSWSLNSNSPTNKSRILATLKKYGIFFYQIIW